MILAAVTALVVIVIICAPFLIGRGGALASASALSSVDHLEKVKNAIIGRYVKDQQAFENKEIGKKSWRGRQGFLLRRYVDAARRLDYLNAQK